MVHYCSGVCGDRAQRVSQITEITAWRTSLALMPVLASLYSNFTQYLLEDLRRQFPDHHYGAAGRHFVYRVDSIRTAINKL